MHTTIAAYLQYSTIFSIAALLDGRAYICLREYEFNTIPLQNLTPYLGKVTSYIDYERWNYSSDVYSKRYDSCLWKTNTSVLGAPYCTSYCPLKFELKNNNNALPDEYL